MCTRLFAIVLGAYALARVAVSVQHSESIIEIPEAKIDLVVGKGDDWWTKHVTKHFQNLKNELWGNDLPQVTASAAQDHQRCPVIKLPATFSSAAKSSSWRRLYGEWNMGNDVTVATFEQNYLMMGFSRNINQVSVLFRTAATGQVAVRTRPFSDDEMMELFNWKAQNVSNAALAKSKVKGSKSATKSAAAAKGTNATSAALPAQTHADFNLAIFDCAGALMYVVKEKQGTPAHIELFSRDGSLVSSSVVGQPVLRYQFVDPSSGNLIATAEAPGINASIARKDIPKNIEFGNILPFGFKFEEGGYTNSSALMENEYRWVLATAVEALAIYKAEAAPAAWSLVTAIEVFLIACIVASVLLVGGLFFCIYRCVFPSGWLAANPFLAQKNMEWEQLNLRKRGISDAPRNYSTVYSSL